MAQKLIIDADPGIGDALAIAVAVLDPNIDLLAVTATAGRVSGTQATRNIHGLLAAIDPPKMPRIGSSDDVATDIGDSVGAKLITTADLHGLHGLGECDFRSVTLHRPHESAKVMIDLVRNYPHEITLLTLGPLTNVQVACERAPEFLTMLNRIVCQGGAFGVGGDATAAAEFNIYGNPESARHVLNQPATKTLVPLDATREVVLTFDQFNRIGSGSQGAIMPFLNRILPFALRAHHQHLGQEGIRLHELAALALISEPRFFETESLAVDIETTGELTRGMTVLDRRGTPQWQANLDAVTGIDAQGVLDYLVRIAAMK